MAIAGSGGWVPSCRVAVENGQLIARGNVSNKPPEVVYSDGERGARGSLADAIERLSRKEPITVDMTNGQFLRLVELWRQRTETRPLPEWAREAAG